MGGKEEVEAGWLGGGRFFLVKDGTVGESSSLVTVFSLSFFFLFFSFLYFLPGRVGLFVGPEHIIKMNTRATGCSEEEVVITLCYRYSTVLVLVVVSFWNAFYKVPKFKHHSCVTKLPNLIKCT